MFEEIMGQCIGCKKTYSNVQAARHLLTCNDVQKFLHAQSPNELGYMLKVSCMDEPDTYWMYVTIPLGEKLSFLDQFLRDVWVECCGHISMFAIEDTFYCSDPGPGEYSMKKKLNTILYPGLSFGYMYDFESPTDLHITVIGHPLTCSSKEINILMRNEEPVFECENCGEQSDRVCDICFETVCRACVPTHECVIDENDTYMMLPLVNSPRTGICSYGGMRVV